MKVKTLCTTALLASLGVTLLGGTVAKAAPESLPSPGKVTVSEGQTIGETDPTPDPEVEGGEITKPTDPGITPNPDKGSIAVERVSVLDFDSIGTSSNKIEKYAKEVKWTEGAGEQKRGSFIVFNDVRANEKYGYTVTAKMTKQFALTSDSSKQLTNATINYQNAHLDAVKGNDNIKPSSVKSSFTIDDKNATTVVTALKANKEGKGQYTLEFGRSADYTGTNGTKGTSDKSVQLVVPSATASGMNTGDYTAEITWSIVAE